MQWEDPRLAYAVTPDNIGQALSGINSAKWPEDFARIAALPQAERPAAVAAFYQKNFYNQWLAQLGIEIQKRAFDCGINEGSGVAIKVLQESVNVVRKTAPFIAEDGLWGPATVTAADSVDQAALVATFIEGRCARYREIGGPYLAQWLARAQA
jgi:lysozyme family protein